MAYSRSELVARPVEQRSPKSEGLVFESYLVITVFVLPFVGLFPFLGPTSDGIIWEFLSTATYP